MEMNSQRRSSELRGRRIRKYDAPRLRGRFAVAATGEKASHAADGMADGQSRGARVERRQERHFLEMGVKENGQDAANQAAVPQAEQHPRGNQHAVGVNRNAAKVKKNGMHR